jgi:hypothetical protein
LNTIALTLLVATMALAQDEGGVGTGDGGGSASVPSGVYRIEEDWVVDVGEPSPETDSPQLTLVFGPADPDSSTHAVFEINHSTQPSFQEGGMQLQCWYGDWLVGYRNQHHPAELYVNNETLTFTSATDLKAGKLTMEVLNGQSASFGGFGGEVYLRISLNSWRENLDGFDSEFSIRHSKCGWGANRVKKFSRKAIRYYDSDGDLIQEDKTERIIHQSVN